MDNFMSQDISALALALSKFQGQVGPIPKKKKVKVKSKSTGTEYEYYYADLADIRDATQKPLADNELSICQIFSPSLAKNYLVTTLLHSSGQWMRSSLEIADHDKLQELGSEMTYLRRYGLSAMLGIVTEEDEDGQAANEAGRKQSYKKQAPESKASAVGEHDPLPWKPAQKKQPSATQSPPMPSKGNKLGELKMLLLEADQPIEKLEEYLAYRCQSSGYTVDKTLEIIFSEPQVMDKFFILYGSWLAEQKMLAL